MTIKERLKMTIANIEFQKGHAFWDDVEKLEHILALFIEGKSINDEFEWVDNHFEVLKDHINNLEN